MRERWIVDAVAAAHAELIAYPQRSCARKCVPKSEFGNEECDCTKLSLRYGDSLASDGETFRQTDRPAAFAAIDAEDDRGFPGRVIDGLVEKEKIRSHLRNGDH